MPSLTNRLKLALPLGNEYVNRAILNKIFEDIDRLVMLQADFDTAKKEIDDNLAKKLSKSGDTMTGDLSMQANMKLQGDTERNLAFRTLTDNREFAKMYANPDKNRVGLYSTKNAKNVWEYDGSTDSFNVNTNTNLLKKTGDIMSGSMTMDVKDGQKRFVWAGNNINTGFNASDDTATQNFSMVDYKNNRTIWSYEPLTNSFNFRGDMNVPWVKKMGDTMTGNLTMDNRMQIFFQGTDGKRRAALAVDEKNRFFAWDEIGGKYFFVKNEDGTFTVNADNLVKKADIYTDWITPLGTPKPVPNGVDMNTIIDPGIWQANSNPNLPDTGGQWFIVEVIKHTSTYVVQRATRFASTVPDTYERTMNAGVWGAWKRVAFIDEVMKKSGDTATGEMIFRHNIQQQSSDGKNGIVSVINLSQTKWAVGPRVEGTVDWSKELSMSLVTGEVSVAGLKVKGERALTISDAEEKTPSRSGKDENGIFTTYEETQEDGKLWKRSVLSSPDADGNYLVRTVTYYKDGVSYKTKIFDLKYDEDGDFVKAVPR